MAKKAANKQDKEFNPQSEASTDVLEEQPPQRPAIVQATLNIPAVVDCQGYAAGFIDFRGMTNRQRAGLHRAFIAAGRENKRFQVRGMSHPDGKAVSTMGDFIRWLAEQLADAYELETGRDPVEGISFG